LNPIRQLELFKDRSKVQADTTISDAEKTKKFAEIDAALAKLK
jgi:phosphonate transport system substrate-binding protein